ncbi:hypothetical protein J3459_006431 [Metarhizium acridum]|nr:hypothetical protein J3459_006431 [Metarhizium acridum]
MTQCSADSIGLWLSQIQQTALTDDDVSDPKVISRQRTDNRKRRAPMTPPPTEGEEDKTPKRRRRNAENLDDRTPRQANRGNQPLLRQELTRISAAASQSSASQSSATHSSASGRSSPRKRLASTALFDDGVQIGILDRSTPRTVTSFMAKFTSIGDGIRVIPPAFKDRLGAENRISSYDSFRFSTSDPPAATRFEFYDELASVAAWAARCERKNSDEATWNSLVHSLLMRLAIHGSSHLVVPNVEVDFEQCTSSDIIKNYLPTAEPGKRVDFVFCLNLGSSDRSKLNRLRRRLPLNTVNHTDNPSLVLDPICVSIETKKAASSTDEARKQLAVWQASQWKQLTMLLYCVDENRAEEDVASRLAELPFLPGVIINGHEWSLYVTTREGETTTIWAEKPFGSTRDLLGVIKVLSGLHELLGWSREVFSPWYQKHVLSCTI